jgi:hypothetical protein
MLEFNQPSRNSTEPFFYQPTVDRWLCKKIMQTTSRTGYFLGNSTMDSWSQRLQKSPRIMMPHIYHLYHGGFAGLPDAKAHHH